MATVTAENTQQSHKRHNSTYCQRIQRGGGGLLLGAHPACSRGCAAQGQSSIGGHRFSGKPGNGAPSAGSASSASLGTELHQWAPLHRPTRERSSISGIRRLGQPRDGSPSAGSTCQRGAASLTSGVAAKNGFPQTNPTQADVGGRGSERRADTPRQGVSEGGRNGVTERFPSPAVAPRLLVKTSRPSVRPSVLLRSRTHISVQPCWSGERQPQKSIDVSSSS